MKRTKSSIAILVATLSIVVGIVVFVVGMGVLKWDFNKIDATEYTAKRYEAESVGAIRRVDLNIDSFPIVVKTGERVSLDYYEATSSDVSVTADGDTLKVVEKYRFNPFKTGLFNVSKMSHKYILTVPDDTNISLSGANCDISASGIEFTDLNIDVTNLRVELTDCSAQTVTVHSTNLGMCLVRFSARSLSVHSVNDDIELNDCAIDAVTVSSVNTDVDIERLTAKRLELDGTNGDYTLRDIAVDELSLDCVNMDADISIRGVRAEYTIRTDGKDLPREQTGTTDKTISLTGVNCDVELEFNS